MANPYEERARAAKATDIALRARHLGITADQVKSLDEEGRQALLGMTKHKNASDQTWEVVGSVMSAMEKAASSDPFEGIING